MIKVGEREQKPTKCCGTVIKYESSKSEFNKIKRKHPATFPDKIPLDFIKCFSLPNDIILDPFMGSGTTAFCAKQLNRNYIGFEISQEYCDIAEERLKCANLTTK